MVWGKYVYLFPNGNCGQSATGADFPGFPAARVTPAYPCDTRTYGDDFKYMYWYAGSPSNVFRHYTVPPTQQFAWVRSWLYNGLYYNPATTYLPWKPYYDGTTNCPSGTYSSTTKVCTPGNASTTSTMSHPYYGSSTSQSNMNLFATLSTPLDSSSKPLFNYIFRMYPGMIVPTGASYRLCTTAAASWNPSGAVTNSCASSWTGPTTKTQCLVNGTITSCASNMGMIVGTTGSDKIDLSQRRRQRPRRRVDPLRPGHLLDHQLHRMRDHELTQRNQSRQWHLRLGAGRPADRKGRPQPVYANDIYRTFNPHRLCQWNNLHSGRGKAELRELVRVLP